MALRLGGLADLDPAAVPLPAGAEVVTRVERIVDGELRPAGATGRVVKLDSERIEVVFIDGRRAIYLREELTPRTHLLAMASRLVEVPGVVAVVLGGSRAIGCHRPDSDIDLGLYYRGRLDVEALRGLAAELADRVFGVFEPGGWGPWVNGGAWLEVAGVRVDWIYRDLGRVTQVWGECRAGRYEIGIQAGHPLGFYSHAYPGEVALCRILADPTGELGALRAATQHYPDALAEALVAATWEPDLVMYGAASHGVAAVEPWYAAGCLFRAIGVLGHALHGHHRVWITSEKRLIDSAGRLRDAPAEFTRRAQVILAHIGATSDEIATAVDAARTLVADTMARLPARPTLALPQ